MHVLHYVATDADSPKSAFSIVKNHLEQKGDNFWSDWHVVGGGRWNKNSNDPYTDCVDSVISYVKNEKEFLNAIQWSKNRRKQEMKTLFDRLHENNGEAQFFISALEYIKKVDSPADYMNAYYINRISNMLLDNWTSDSYYYDIEARTSSYRYIFERIKDNPDSSYLVPVDFHF